MKYNADTHYRRSIRLKGYDYSKDGVYFVTMCTQNRECLFGEIKNGEMIFNEYGEIIKFTWFDLINHNVNILLDYFVIMPNHIHGIIVITNNENIVGAGSKPALVKSALIKNNHDVTRAATRVGLEPTPTKCELSEIVRQLKTFSAKRINQLRGTSSVAVWQRNYYDHIIRNENELNQIREYVVNNSLKWDLDRNNVENLYM